MNRRGVAAFTVWAMLVQTLGAALLLAPATPAAAQQAGGAAISVTKGSPAELLAGETARYEITVTNTGSELVYNASISDLLPLNATFAGNVSPASAGQPTISTDPVTGRTVLLWLNLTDIPQGGSYTISFDVDLGVAADTVGNVIINDASAASSTDERDIPDFDASGDPVGSDTTQTASDSLTTRITALQMAKAASNAPDGELLRGVHDNRSVYTLTLTNNDVAATANTVVTDYIPAGMEFLACGNVDNSVTTTEEYPGSGPLGSPALNPDPCPTPVSVETLENPTGPNLTLPGVYTKVTWNVGTLAPGEVREITYVAGIPLRANTTSWAGGTVPSPSTGEQGANLDNNNGASTQELASEGSLRNLAVTTGTYTGPVAPGTSPEVSANGSTSVSVEDLRMRKSLDPTNPAVGQIVQYTLTIDTSEYVSARDIVVTDELPDGMCPVGPGLPSGDPACVGGAAPSVPFASVTQNTATGGYTLVFDPVEVPSANGTITITYDALFRDTYNDFGPNAGLPTVAGDSFTNSAALTGQTVPAVDSGESVQDVVLDDASATFTTAAEASSKQLKPRYVGTTCDPNEGQPYANPEDLTQAQLSFRKGDLICFKLRVQFPSSVTTRNAVVTDFIPPGTSYVDRSFTPTAANTVAITGPAVSPEALQVLLGSQSRPGSDDYFVDPGGVFEATLAVRVDSPARGAVPDITANLLKVRYESTDGTTFGDRDQAGFEVLPAPNIAAVKGVYAVDAPPSGPNGPNIDGVQVQQNSTATFRVDITNSPFPGFEDLDYAIRGLRAWDVLPVGITCADISDFQYQTAGPIPNPTPTLTPLPAGIATCYDPGTGPAITPAFGDRANQGLIVWEFPSPDVTSEYAIPAGNSMTLTYRMAIPPVVSVTTRYDNTVALQSYQAFTNETNVTTTYYPQDNIDPSVPLQDAPPASDPSWVFTADAAVTKAQTTAITEQNNNEAAQATIGEEVTYTVSAIIPAQTTVYNAVLRDPLPRNGSTQQIELLSATQSGPVPLTLDADTGTATATLTFPPTYTNSTDAAQTFTMTITGRVTTVGQNRHNQARTNTVTFTSTTSLDGNPLPPRQAQTTLRIVEPNPSVTKTSSPATVVGGQTVQYTVTVRNANGRPPLHDAFTIDCLPALLTYTGEVSVSAGTVSTQPGDGANGCDAGTTRIEWLIGTVSAGTPQTLVYTALVDPQVVAGTSLTNPVTVSGSSLATGSITPTPIEREYTANSSATIAISGSQLIKSVSPGTATIGDVVTYTVSGTIRENTNSYEATLLDTLPAGLDANVDLVSVQCIGDGCAQIEANPGYGTLLTGNGQQIGVYVGDALTVPNERTVVATYRTTVLNQPVDAVGAPNQAGATPDNTATIWWSTDANAPRPGSVLDPPALPGATSRGPVSAEFLIIEPQVRIAKSVSNANPQPGQSFTYSVAVNNPTGPTVSTAYEVVVSDTIPAGVVVDPASISDGGVLTGADPTTGGGTITWTLGDLDPGEGTTLTYSAVLAPSGTLTAAPLTNTAAIDQYFSLPDGNAERRQYSGPSATATVNPQFPRIVTEKSVAAGSEALIDEPFSWRITVRNTGGADAFNVDVNDTLPINWCYVAGSAKAALPDGTVQSAEPTVTGACAGDPIQQSLAWTDLFDLPAGAAATITIQTVPTALVIDTPGVGLSVPQTNTAVATGEDATGATENKDGSYSAGPDDAVAGIRQADLSISKTADPTLVAAGTTATFRITVTNEGPDASLAPILVSDQVPLPLLLSTAGGTSWACITAGQLVTCEYTGAPLAPGASLPELVITASVPNDVANGLLVVNTAVVVGATLDTNPDNNTDNAFVTVQRLSDLQIVKTTTSQPIVPGEDVTYDLAVTNLGPSAADGPIKVADTLPAPLVPVAASGTGWTCQITGQDVTCSDPDDLPATAPGNALPVITVTAQLPADFTGSLVNTATVTGQSPDPNPGNNTSTVTDPAVPTTDLFITKTTVTSPVVAGNQIEYTLDVGNLGPSTAAAPTTVTDVLPTGLTFVSASGSDWTCSYAAQSITCTYGLPLPANVNAAPITVVAAVDPDVTGDVTNPASVTGPGVDPNPDNNTDEVTDPTTAVADLAVAKTTVTDPVVPGEDVTYEVVVSNLGPSTSRAPITVSDPLPDGLTFVSAAGTGWTCTAEVVCTLGTGLPAGADAATITITAALDPDFTGDLVNGVRVTGTTPDPNPDNNTDTVVDPTEPAADLAITKTTATSPVVPGQQLTYQLSVTNNGPSTSRATITVSDPLPAGVSFVSATGTGWTCDDTITCVRDTDLAAGETAPTITVVGQVDAGVTGDLTNTATVTGTTPDPNPDNNTSTVVDPTEPAADLAITKATATSPVVPGEDVTYTLSVTNNGPSVSREPITVTDTLDPALTFVSADGSGWTCGNAAQAITCTYSTDLPPNVNAPDITVVATLDPDFTGSLPNTATVTGTTPDPNPDNNTSTVVDPTTALADLTIDKTTITNPIVPGRDVTYEIVVTNNGSSTSRAPITVTDILDPALTYVSADGPGWTCDASITCVWGTDLAAGATTDPITVVATLSPAFTGDLPNLTTVTATTTEPDTENNTDQVIDPTSPLADLAIDKQTATNPVVPGEQVSYTLSVTNNGPSDSVAPITVSDTLDPALTYFSGSGTNWTCTAVGQDVTCVYGQTIAAGTSAPDLVLVADLDADFTGDLPNTATVSGTTPDPDPDNNTDTVTDPTTAVADLAIDKTTVTNPIVAGEEVTYTLSVTNNGPSTSRQPITVTDTLDPALTFVSATGTGWTCDGTITCVRDTDLAAGATADPITVVAALDPDFTGDLPNTATVTVTTPDPNPENNTDEVTDPTTAVADLAVAKTTVTDPVVPGEDVTYEVVVSNLGPSTSRAPITVSDPLPDGLTFVSAVGTGWTCTAEVVCTLGTDLPAGADAATITITAALDPDFTGDLVNGVRVTGTTPDPNPDNNTDTVVDPTEPAADLAITKTTVTSPDVPGEEVTYTLSVTNNGPSTSRATITVTDVLNPVLTFVSAGGPGWTCDDTITCVRDTDLAAGATADPITVVTTLDPDFTGDLTNSATVTGTTPDPNPDNNTDTVTDPTDPTADLAITKTTATSPVVPGEDVTYTLSVANNGPSTSRQPITVTDTLDPALTFVSADGAGWTCDDTITCVRDTDLAAGATADPITVVATLDPAFTGDLTNTATVTGTTPDPQPENNTDTVVDPTEPAADLAISKTTLTQDFVQGGSVEYELVVTNNGPSDSAATITVTDTLPEALTYIDASGDGWACAANGQEVTCTRDTLLAAGQTAPPIRVAAELATAFFGDLTNPGEVTGTTPDPDPDNNTDEVTDPVPPLVDLAVTKAASGGFVVGAQGTFIVTVVNNGPTADPGPVTVVDQLPDGLSYVSATGEGWECSAAGQQITCNYPEEFAVGSPSVITVVVDVLAAAAPETTNSAQVGSESKDTDPGNNRDEVSVPVTVPADRTPGTGANVTSPLLLGVLALLMGGLAIVFGTRMRRRS